jgi:carboxyl-terminal processing protease
MKIEKTYLPILLFSCIALGIVIDQIINYPASKEAFGKKYAKTKLNSLLDFIDKEYIEDAFKTRDLLNETFKIERGSNNGPGNLIAK